MEPHEILTEFLRLIHNGQVGAVWISTQEQNLKLRDLIHMNRNTPKPLRTVKEEIKIFLTVLNGETIASAAKEINRSSSIVNEICARTTKRLSWCIYKVGEDTPPLKLYDDSIKGIRKDKTYWLYAVDLFNKHKGQIPEIDICHQSSFEPDIRKRLKEKCCVEVDLTLFKTRDEAESHFSKILDNFYKRY